MNNYLWQEGEKYLAIKEDFFKHLIELYHPCPLTPKSNYFAELCKTIISQQLSNKAAFAIEKRFNDYFSFNPTPASILATSFDDFRKIGLSPQKISYITNLAEKINTKALSLDHLDTISDEEIHRILLPLKGIGEWTVNVFLIFSLARPDVFPFDDLGLKKAVQRFDKLAMLPNRDYLYKRAETWRPHRTLAAWYLWRSLNNN